MNRKTELLFFRHNIEKRNCQHEAVLAARGGITLLGGDVYDDIETKIICRKCGSDLEKI